MKNVLIAVLKELIGANSDTLGRFARIVFAIVAAACAALIFYSCSATYVHRMSYTNGEEVATFECETQAAAKK